MTVHVSLIYKLLVLQLLVGEANTALDRLGLEGYRISSPAAVIDFVVFPPKSWTGEVCGLDANLQTTNLTFSLTSGGDLEVFGFTCVQGLPGAGRIEDWRDRNGEARVPPRTVSDRGAHLLARDWLERLGFDVAAMERADQVRVTHLPLPPKPGNLCSTRYLVRWGGEQRLERGYRPTAQVKLNLTEKFPVSIDVWKLDYHKDRLPRVPHEVAVSLLQDGPVVDYLTSHKLSWRSPEFTNVFSLLRTTPQYETSLRGALMKEAAEILSILGCDQLDEPREENLLDIYANPPAFGPGGRLEFRNGEMRFDRTGKLTYFQFLPRGQTNFNVWKTLQKSIISSNEAYQIVVSKASNLSLDVPALDRDCRRSFYRGQFHRLRDTKSQKTVRFETPEYYFEWYPRQAQNGKALATIVVYGDIRQVGKIELMDTRYLGRPPISPSAHSQ